MKKLVYYCPYYGLVHLCLIRMGWEEHHCLYVGEERMIKMVTYVPVEELRQPNQYA